MKILVENLQLSAQNLDLGRRFIFQQENHPKPTSKSVTAWLQKKFCLQWVLIQILLEIYDKNWKFE